MVVHLIADVVEVEKVVDEVAADPHLLVPCEGVAHRGEQATLESVECSAFLLAQTTTLKKPSLGVGRGALAMRVDSKTEGARGDEVGEDELGRARLRGRGNCCDHVAEVKKGGERMWGGEVGEGVAGSRLPLR